MEWISWRLAALAVCSAIITGAVIVAQDKSQRDGVYRANQAQRGATLYESYCANCHGTDLAGGDLAPALLGAEFDEKWNGQSLGQLFERIKTTMPQDNPDSLSRPQNADILAFILQKSGAPAGATELPAQVETLNTIKFSVSKP
jgi:mono/diheme cytochrome c family protein